MRQEFETILQAVRAGCPAELRRQVGEGVYVRRFLPPERLILLGGGHVALALYRAALALDFAVTVVDDRPEFARADRFPEALTLCAGFAEAVPKLAVGAGDYVCILTRGHESDMVCLRQLLSGPEPRYLGMIGSHRRVTGVKQLLIGEGFDPGRLARLHAPIGLNIGAVTPGEIAVSIAGELIAVRHAQEQVPGLLPQQNTDFAALNLLQDDRQRVALLLVLSTRGSTPVKGGALMALAADGRMGGTIGGGPGEGKALELARECLATGTPCQIRVDMTGLVATGELVCGGVMDVWIEPLQEA